jgi:hypothetical protein
VEDLKIIRMMAHAPRMNVYCERVIGTFRSELLDQVLIVNERHLVTALSECLIHYNRRVSKRPPEIGVQPSERASSPRRRRPSHACESIPMNSGERAVPVGLSPRPQGCSARHHGGILRGKSSLRPLVALCAGAARQDIATDDQHVRAEIT